MIRHVVQLSYLDNSYYLSLNSSVLNNITKNEIRYWTVGILSIL